MIILMFLAGTAKKMRTRFIAVLFCCLLTVGESESKSSIAGQNVTLTCTYDIRKHGRVAACWGRGDLLMFGCKDQIVATDGLRVTQQSPKYKLLGRLTNGDVSLTILNVKKEDAGKYACRVEVFGMFNDEKHNFELIIKDAPQTTTLQTFTYAKSISTPDATKTPNQTVQVTSSEGLQTSSSSISFKTEKRDVPAWGVAMGVLFGLILLGAAIIIIIIRQKKAAPQQNSSAASVRPFGALQLYVVVFPPRS
ncbi:T-cell immunoglobulin and mucin domain-containing protein 4-like isoform X6 [Syngnathus acus]|uniref:T-cell immunoglobulin and mucin domain-containing protein 4-like isoform X6 n=1 Tax=Syngnathus acus TaxID=161584 RepID=UPI00188631F5|nr:T-cell immunoglobulin and mucin domain-containing protein 4-like isoform X6 [Syngnathus acus]